MYPAMQVRYAFLQALFIRAPRHVVHSRRSFFLQQIKAVPQQSLVHVVQKRREP
jgi:hypothetical protein